MNKIVGSVGGPATCEQGYDAAVATEQQDDERTDVAGQVARESAAARVQSDGRRSPTAAAAAAADVLPTPTAAPGRRQTAVQ